jgi:hypothetical protein
VKALLDLAARWREEAGLLRGYGASEAATAAELHAQQVVEAVKRAEDEELTLEEAAVASGYSKRRLSELIADGTIPNVGRKGAPRIRRADLPRKAKAPSNGFDAGAEVRAIMGAGG